MEQSDIADHDFLLFSLVEQSDIAVLSHVAVRHCCSLSWSSQTLLFSLVEQSDIADHDFLLFSLVEQSDIAVLSHGAVRHC